MSAQSVSQYVSASQLRTSSRPPRHRRRASQDPLVGRFFHSFEPAENHPDAPTRIVKWQGHILGRIDDHTYLVGLYSWLDGSSSTQHLQPLAGMADWQFYASHHDMNEWYEDIYSWQVKRYFEAEAKRVFQAAAEAKS